MAQNKRVLATPSSGAPDPATIVVGLDLSLVSPGVCIYVGNVYKLFYFSQRKRGEAHRNCVDRVSVTMLGPIPGPEYDDTERYYYIASLITIVITDAVPEHATSCVEVYIEHYAFSKSSAHSFKLHELGGVVKLHVVAGVPRPCRYQTPGTYGGYRQLEKRMCGDGNASKQDVCTCIGDVYPMVDLLSMCGLHLTSTGVLPNPVSWSQWSVGSEHEIQ
jgi:hypothetical protein